MTTKDLSRDGGADWQAAPELSALLYPARQSPRIFNRRILTKATSIEDRGQALVDALPELRKRRVADALAANELATLARMAAAGPKAMSDRVLPVLRRIIDRRWTEIGPGVVATILFDPQEGDEVLKALPAVVESAEFIDGLEEAEKADVPLYPWRFDFGSLAEPSADQLRRLLPIVSEKYEGDLSAHLLAAAAKRRGWTPWLVLFGILLHATALASDRAPATPPRRPSPSFRDEEREPTRLAVWFSLRASTQARSIARLLDDLRLSLKDAPRDLWETYAAQLSAAVGDDDAWRAPTVEALLWIGAKHNRRLAVFTASALLRPGDLAMLEQLFDHPDRRTQYEARALADALKPTPVAARHTTGLQAPPNPAGRAGKDNAASDTWIGQALVERLISDEIASLEDKFAKAYPNHHRDGEEKLNERFFSELGVRFEILSAKMAAMARDCGAATRSEILVRYRPVDKQEEGAPGIRRPGQRKAPKKFSADLCLVVEARLNGAPLAKRATLVQAKRIYAADRAGPDAGWEPSFHLKPEQSDALLKQTESSFYLFQGPGFGGRGMPVIPARLVDELATHQAPARTRISTAAVGRASQSLAEWFTYELVALRTGDPCQPLVDKAMGGPGSKPYDLAQFGVVEIEVRIGEPLREKG